MRLGDILFYFLTCSVSWWWSSNFPIFGISPDFVFIAVFSAAVMAGPVKSLFLSFMFGIFMDVYCWGAFGLYALFYTLVSYSIYRIKFKIDLNSPFSRIVSCLILNWIFLAAYQAVAFMIFRDSVLLYKTIIFQPVFNALLLELVFGFLYRIKVRSSFWL